MKNGFSRDLAVPPGYRVVSAEAIDLDGETYFSVEVSPQYWNPRYWLHRWRMRRAKLIAIEVTK